MPSVQQVVSATIKGGKKTATLLAGSFTASGEGFTSLPLNWKSPDVCRVTVKLQGGGVIAPEQTFRLSGPHRLRISTEGVVTLPSTRTPQMMAYAR